MVASTARRTARQSAGKSRKSIEKRESFKYLLIATKYPPEEATDRSGRSAMQWQVGQLFVCQKCRQDKQEQESGLCGSKREEAKLANIVRHDDEEPPKSIRPFWQAEPAVLTGVSFENICTI